MPREFPGALKKKPQEVLMTDSPRPLCDCPEPCACYAEGYAAGSGTETGTGTAFPEGGFERLGLL